MNDDELLDLMKRVDPQAVRLPPGIKEIAAEIEAVEREGCARICDLLGGEIDMRDPDEVKLAANSLAYAIRERSNDKLSRAGP